MVDVKTLVGLCRKGNCGGYLEDLLTMVWMLLHTRRPAWKLLLLLLVLKNHQRCLYCYSHCCDFTSEGFVAL